MSGHEIAKHSTHTFFSSELKDLPFNIYFAKLAYVGTVRLKISNIPFSLTEIKQLLEEKRNYLPGDTLLGG